MISGAPRILFLTPCFPNGRSSGSHLRVRQIGRAFQAIGEVQFGGGGFAPRRGDTSAPEFGVDKLFPLEPAGTKNRWSGLREAVSSKTINPCGHAVEPAAR